MGLRHIQKKADRVLLFPADVPMITADTIEKMAQAPGSMAVDVYKRQSWAFSAPPEAARA